VRIKQAEMKVAEAEKKLADFIATMGDDAVTETIATPSPAAVQTTMESTIANDPVAESIARAQAKLAMSPADKLRANLDSLRLRLEKAEEKVAQAKAEGSASLDALQQGTEKLRQKIADALAELNALDAIDKPAAAASAKAEQTAAQIAIAKAKAKAAAKATMSDEEKHAQQIQAMQSRLQKARERLEKAEAENDLNIDAFRLGVTKLEERLNEMS
jgi:electron transport complex protein RnfC